MSDWVLYGGLAWVALALFFWALLAVSARADRRDDAQVAPQRTGRFARARDLFRPHASAGRGGRGEEADEETARRSQRGR